MNLDNALLTVIAEQRIVIADLDNTVAALQAKNDELHAECARLQKLAPETEASE